MAFPAWFCLMDRYIKIVRGMKLERVYVEHCPILLNLLGIQCKIIPEERRRKIS